jgi:hypothetical protein
MMDEAVYRRATISHSVCLFARFAPESKTRNRRPKRGRQVQFWLAVVSDSYTDLKGVVSITQRIWYNRRIVFCTAVFQMLQTDKPSVKNPKLLQKNIEAVVLSCCNR